LDSKLHPLSATTSSANAFAVENPASGEVIAYTRNMTSGEIDKVRGSPGLGGSVLFLILLVLHNKQPTATKTHPVGSLKVINEAYDAFPAWRDRTAKDRAALLRKWAALLHEHSDYLSKLITAENGKPAPEARGEVAYGACKALRGWLYKCNESSLAQAWNGSKWLFGGGAIAPPCSSYSHASQALRSSRTTQRRLCACTGRPSPQTRPSSASLCCASPWEWCVRLAL
jgi:hypothetical protein